MNCSDYIIKNLPHTTQFYPAKSRVLNAGENAQNLYIIKSGAARVWFNKDGKDYTLQFFLEGDSICIYDSLMRNAPTEFTLETIEPTELLVFKREDVMENFNSNHAFQEELMHYFVDKMVNYVHLFLSMQVNTPEQRYDELVKNRPDIIRRIPQYYIASFLGITSVSLSRIRGRKWPLPAKKAMGQRENPSHHYSKNRQTKNT